MSIVWYVAGVADIAALTGWVLLVHVAFNTRGTLRTTLLLLTGAVFFAIASTAVLTVFNIQQVGVHQSTWNLHQGLFLASMALYAAAMRKLYHLVKHLSNQS